MCVFGLRVGPNMFGLMLMGSVMLSICARCVLYSAVSGVKRVDVGLSELRMRFFCVSVYVFPVGMIECLLLLCLCRCMLMLCRLRML